LENLSKEQVLPHLLKKWARQNSAIININHMTKAGNYHKVTMCGKGLMEILMCERSILVMEKLLIQELPKSV
jgi:hypothetical protein